MTYDLGYDSLSRRALRFALVILLSIGIVALAWSAVHLATRKDDRPVPLNCSSIDNLQTDFDSVYFYMDDKLYCYTDKGVLKWQFALGAGADYRVCDAGVAAWNGNKLFLIARNGDMMYTGTLATDIISCAICSSLAAVETEVNGARLLSIIEYSGREIDRLDMSSRTLLDFGFFNNNTMLWVLTLDTEGTVPLTQVDTYQPARFQTGSIPDSSQIIYRVILDNNDLVLVGTNTLERYTYVAQRQPDFSRLIYGWYYADSYSDDKRDVCLFVPERESDTTARIKDMRVITGGSDYTCHFQADCMGIFAGSSAAYAVSNRYVFKNVYGSEGVKAYSIPLYVDQVVDFTDSGVAVVVSQQRVYLMPLP